VGNDFDFAKSNEVFAEQAKDTAAPPAPGSSSEFYNRKTSFFDNISSTAKEKAEGVENQTAFERRGEERKLNLETFGQASVHHGRGRGRGRGRGNYRGRGSGRGGRGESHGGSLQAS
jgi:protein LSM14